MESNEENICDQNRRKFSKHSTHTWKSIRVLSSSDTSFKVKKKKRKDFSTRSDYILSRYRETRRFAEGSGDASDFICRLARLGLENRSFKRPSGRRIPVIRGDKFRVARLVLRVAGNWQLVHTRDTRYKSVLGAPVVYSFGGETAR